MDQDIIYSESFKKWFGDWENDPEHSSKVVNNDGNPLVVYHGSYANFDAFNISKGRTSEDIQGIYLTPDYKEAKLYGNNVRAFYANIRNPADGDIAYKVWYKYHDKGENDAGVKARKDLESMGYDGIINVEDSNYEYVAFYPNQVKSIYNKGLFNPKSKNIYEKIIRKNNKWIVTDHTGEKNLGTYSTKEEAEKRLKQVEYFKNIDEKNKIMNNYTQFFDKYTEKTVNINGVAYQANLVNAVTSYLKSNGYQITNNSIASGCQALFNKFGKKSTGITSGYGKDNNVTYRINNVLATVFPPKQNTTQQPQVQTSQGQAQPPQNPEDDGLKNPGDNPPKDDLPQDDLMNDLAGISMLTKDELRAMVNKGSLPKIMKNLMDSEFTIDPQNGKIKKDNTLVKKAAKLAKNAGNKVSSFVKDLSSNDLESKDSIPENTNPIIKIPYIQIIGTDNIYDNDDSTINRSRKSNNKQQNKSNKVKQGNKNGQVKA